MTKKIKEILKNNKQAFLLLLFLGDILWYALLQRLVGSTHIVHSSLDDMIPFWPAFIIPYCIWYLYIPLPMFYLCFKDRKAFVRQSIYVFGGMYMILLFLSIYPTSIDFRPEISGGGIFSRMCALIYSTDRPISVCPSLHCYEAAAIHLSTFNTDIFKKRKLLRAASGFLAIIICLSTMFIKQHSVVDVISAVILAALLYFLVYKTKIFNKKLI